MVLVMVEKMVDLMVFQMAYHLVDVMALKWADSMDVKRASLSAGMLDP